MTTAQDRKQQERQARRRRIQRAARTVFAEKGYAKTSIEQIAREASLSVGAIYLYFRSKEDLYVSLLEETLELFDSELRQLRERADLRPSDRLESAWSFFTQWAATDVEATRVLRLTSQPNIRQQLSDEVAKSVGEGLSSVLAHIGALITAGIEAGVYRRVNETETADLVWSLFLGVLQNHDARANLSLPGADLGALARSAYGAIEANLRTQPASVSAAA